MPSVGVNYQVVGVARNVTAVDSACEQVSVGDQNGRRILVVEDGASFECRTSLVECVASKFENAGGCVGAKKSEGSTRLGRRVVEIAISKSDI